MYSLRGMNLSQSFKERWVAGHCWEVPTPQGQGLAPCGKGGFLTNIPQGAVTFTSEPSRKNVCSPNEFSHLQTWNPGQIFKDIANWKYDWSQLFICQEPSLTFLYKAAPFYHCAY